MSNESFAERIKGLRTSQGLSQETVAAGLEISRQTLSRYEKGERTPDMGVLAKMKTFFSVDYEYLFGESKCQTYEEQKKLQDILSKEFLLLSENAKKSIVKSLSKISYSLVYGDVSGEEQACIGLFEDTLSFISEVLEVYTLVSDDVYDLKEKLESCSCTIDKNMLIVTSLNRFCVTATNYKENLIKEVTDFISYMQNILLNENSHALQMNEGEPNGNKN